MNDLIEQAVIAIPVLDKNATHIITTSDEWTGSSKRKGEFFQVNALDDACKGLRFIGGDLDGIEPVIKPGFWKIVCTRIEHIEFRVELFKGAPEGSENYIYGDCKNYRSWYKEVDKVMYVICEPIGVYTWEEVSIYNKSLFIPRPTLEEFEILENSKSKSTPKLYIGDTPKQLANGVKWVPEVGEECEVKWYGSWETTFIVGLDSDGDIVYEVSAFSEGSHFETADKNTEFRSISTEQEKFEEAVTMLALKHGFKLKKQPDGSMALNPYVFEFAKALGFKLNDRSK